MLVRLFKQEAELEVWKQDREGRFDLVKTYPICRWSGDLGPKAKRGRPPGAQRLLHHHARPDESAIGLLPVVQIGYPNAYDRSLGHTGLQANGARRLLVAGLLRHDRRADRRNLRARPRSPRRLERGFQVQAYPVPDDAPRTSPSTGSTPTSRSGRSSRTAPTISR